MGSNYMIRKVFLWDYTIPCCGYECNIGQCEFLIFVFEEKYRIRCVIINIDDVPAS